MKQITPLRAVLFTLAVVGYLTISCRTKDPFKINHELAGGYVIGRESCTTDTTQDYWIIDLTGLAENKQYGDTITLEGKVYTNVVKARGLDTSFQKIGKKIYLGFDISKDKVQTENCQVTTPITYSLKELIILDQSILN